MIPPGLPDKVLVDTSVLRDLAFAEVLPNRRRNVLHKDKDVKVMLEYLRACARRVTITQVFAELDRALMTELKKEKLRNARKQCFGGWPRFLEETTPPRLVTIDLDVVAVIGPTDASLLEVARLQDLHLLTADWELDGRARDLRIPALSVWQVTSHIWFRTRT